MNAAAAPQTGATIAFESIDGPPPQVFKKLVTDLNDEAGVQSVAVVSRNDAAAYRVRGYVSAMVERDKTTFGWVWDVYDAGKNRALRISGEETARPVRQRDAWTAADDALLRRMARDGMGKIAAFLNGPAPAPQAAPEPALPTLVAGRDDSPEAAGIYRRTGGPDRDETTGSAGPDATTDNAPPWAPKRKAAAPSTDGRSAGH